MKKIKILMIIIILSNLHLYSQDIITPQKMKFVNSSSTIFTFNSQDEEYLQGNNFIISWQWDGNYKLSEALKFNTNQTNYENTGNIRANNLLNIWHIKDYSNFLPYENSMGFIYEPTLKIRNFIRFNYKENDPNNSVFGFKTIQTPLTSDNVVDDRLVLHPNINYTNPVLSNPWPDNELDILLKIKIIFKNNIDIFYI